MEKRLRALFDYQHFEQNSNLKMLIDETHRRVRSAALSDDIMSKISAAGDWSSGYQNKNNEENN